MTEMTLRAENNCFGISPRKSCANFIMLSVCKFLVRYITDGMNIHSKMLTECHLSTNKFRVFFNISNGGNRNSPISNWPPKMCAETNKQKYITQIHAFKKKQKISFPRTFVILVYIVCSILNLRPKQISFLLPT